MQEVRYMISDTARKIDVEAHVLRYWEEELKIPIARNEMGHRYYTSDNILLFRNIKELKEQGFQLRAIKILLPTLIETKGENIEELFELKDELNFQVSSMGQEISAEVTGEADNLSHTKEPMQVVKDTCTMQQVHNEKMIQFRMIIKSAVMEALEENNFVMEEQVGNKVIKHVDYLMRESDEKADERFKQLDEAIRMKQKARKEIAVADMEKKKSRWRFGRKKKNEQLQAIKKEDV